MEKSKKYWGLKPISAIQDLLGRKAESKIQMADYEETSQEKLILNSSHRMTSLNL